MPEALGHTCDSSRSPTLSSWPFAESLDSLQPVMGCQVTLTPSRGGVALRELSWAGVSQVLPARLRQRPDRNRRETGRAGVSHLFTRSSVPPSLHETSITASQTTILKHRCPSPSLPQLRQHCHGHQHFCPLITHTTLMYSLLPCICMHARAHTHTHTHTGFCSPPRQTHISFLSGPYSLPQRAWHILEAPC